MKRIVLNITLLLFIVCNSKAQEEKDIILYKNGDILYRSTLASSDNIKFTKLESSMVFNHIQNGNAVKQINVSDIDSICFKTYKAGESVVINGIRWATRDVGAPHTFVANPEDFGESYQWNRGTTDVLDPDAYDNSIYGNADSWLPDNDPSPSGYRVPTFDETKHLWIDQYLLTVPCTRYEITPGFYGCWYGYWSSDAYTDAYVWMLTGVGFTWQAMPKSGTGRIRCVAK